MSDNLATIADRAHISVDTIRAIALAHCGIPAATDHAMLDLWLYERLAMAVNIAGMHYTAMYEESILSMINFSMIDLVGTFEERCNASLADVIANPVVRQEILLAEQHLFWSMPGTSDELKHGLGHETLSEPNELLF